MMPDLNLFQWSAIVGGILLIAWPLVVSLFRRMSGAVLSLPRNTRILDDVVILRKSLAEYPDAVKAIDEVILPAAIKEASKE
jgi:hypothetical protein